MRRECRTVGCDWCPSAIEDWDRKAASQVLAFTEKAGENLESVPLNSASTRWLSSKTATWSRRRVRVSNFSQVFGESRLQIEQLLPLPLVDRLPF